MKGKSLLVDGNIPAHTECPFKGECSFALTNTCRHQGKEHTVPYSCAAARAFNMIRKDK